VTIRNEKNEVLLVKRKFEPEMGKWDLPGGFIEFDETLEQSVIREAKEELGVDIYDLEYLCSAVDFYDFEGIKYHTIGFSFTAKADPKAEINPQDDVSEFRYFNFKDIPWSEIGFESVANALKLLQRNINI
jgi:ADP-ribose pyrophosphatase YjhB (NUDIX family)